MSNFRLDSRAVLLIFSQKHFDLSYRELKSFLSLSHPFYRFEFHCCVLSFGALFILFTRIVRHFLYSSYIFSHFSFLSAVLSLFCSFSCSFCFCYFMWVSLDECTYSKTHIMLSYFTPLLGCCSEYVADVLAQTQIV